MFSFQVRRHSGLCFFLFLSPLLWLAWWNVQILCAFLKVKMLRKYTFFRLVGFLSWSESKMQNMSFLSSLFARLSECLIYSRCSINLCWMTEFKLIKYHTWKKCKNCWYTLRSNQWDLRGRIKHARRTSQSNWSRVPVLEKHEGELLSPYKVYSVEVI